jgi:hypothetical protein
MGRCLIIHSSFKFTIDFLKNLTFYGVRYRVKSMKRTKWTFEKLQEEALKYKTRKEFEKNNPNAYHAAHKRKILDKICSHMEYQLHYWTDEELAQEALKYKTRKEFQKNSNGAYHTAHKRKILDKICSHMEYVNCPWTDEELAEEAKKYETKTEFRKNSPNAYNVSLRRKILDKICSHMVGVRRYWTDEELAEEAKKYKTRVEFQKNNDSAYQTARKRKILDKICSHMEYICYPWTDEELAEEAKKYKTRGEFQKNSPGAYDAARSRKILDKICSHMKTLSGTSYQEIELCGIIKSVYPKTRTLRIRSKRKESLIKGKPHIQGFDLDIYVPELNCGIEYDGDYWHSFDRMKKSRNKKLWPEEDVKNYHQIKDAYFLSKGIELLHIKEKDWKKDKQACIDKCLEFLRTQNG